MSHSLRVRVRRWHRSAGALVGLFVLLLVATGILMNHAATLGLHQRYVAVDSILDLYGIDITPPQQGWTLDGHWVSHAAGRIYFNERAISPAESLVDVAWLPPMIVMASRNTILLTTAQGEIIEKLDSTALPGPVSALRAQGQQLWLRSGRQWWLSRDGLLSWSPSDAPALEHAAPAALPAELGARIARHARHNELTWQRVIADLHSGRIAGRWGVLVMDIASVILGLLAASGLWLWLRSAPRKR